MSTFRTDLDEIVRRFTSDLIRVAVDETVKNERKRKPAEGPPSSVELTKRNGRGTVNQVRGVPLTIATFEHSEWTGHRVVLTRRAPDSPSPTGPSRRMPSRRR